MPVASSFGCMCRVTGNIEGPPSTDNDHLVRPKCGLFVAPKTLSSGPSCRGSRHASQGLGPAAGYLERFTFDAVVPFAMPLVGA